MTPLVAILPVNSARTQEVSQAHPDETFNYLLLPGKVIAEAGRYGTRVVASTYVEPVVFIEYALAYGKLSRTSPFLHLVHSDGFINEKPLDDLYGCMDAACIDLNGFTEDFYRDMTGGSPSPVPDT